ncbi:unnamed protein product [Tetraodon nigroviridis]|uniref:(spotted green pufferfish) hypothetical protein n=1 Tax=Tetraodon nigroviridis TaxID=99883 RepID=Q4RIR6_TETNG|nr:unnamed protein product [Tetraodon nigroviridis]
MEKPQRKPNQRYEGTKSRKVRFKLASSYSGRVLKHVYEDGQELDSPEEKYPHSFVHHKIPPDHLEVGQLQEFEDNPEDQQGPPAGLIAQRINVYRGTGGYRTAADQSQAAEQGAAEADTCQHCGGFRAPPAPCVTAASCPCWRTASMSPSAICVAKLATLMVWRSASPAPASSTVWQTVGPSRAPVSERERAAVCDGQLCAVVRTVSAPVLL